MSLYREESDVINLNDSVSGVRADLDAAALLGQLPYCHSHSKQRMGSKRKGAACG